MFAPQRIIARFGKHLVLITPEDYQDWKQSGKSAVIGLSKR